MKQLRAYEQFMERLSTGELRSGQFVTVKGLAELADVSVAAAREAIQRLESESLLKIYPQRGVQITAASPQFTRSAFQFRLMMECEAVRHFAANAPLESVDELTDAVDAVFAAAKNGVDEKLQDEAVEVDWRIHDTIIEFYDNPLVTEAYRINAVRIRLIRGNSNRVLANRLDEVMREHQQILHACRERNSDSAAQLLANHINDALKRTFEQR